MNLIGRWLALIFCFCVTCEVSLRIFAEELQIEKPKESLLRHQQKRRPAFIERKLVEGGFEEVFEKEEAEEEGGESYRIAFNEQLAKDRGEGLDSGPEKEVPAALIRHGRSRGHFARQQVKVEDPNEVPEEESKGRKEASSSEFNATLESNDDDHLVEGGSRTEQRNVTLARTELVENLARILESVEPRKGSVGFEGNLKRKSTRIESNEEEEEEDDLDDVLDEVDRDRWIGSTEKGSSSRNEEGRKKKPNLAAASRRSRTRNRRPKTVNETTNGTEESVDSVQSSKSFAEDDEGEEGGDEEEDQEGEDYEQREGRNGSRSDPEYEEASPEVVAKKTERQNVEGDIVTKFLRIIENQHLLGENCTAGTHLNLGEGVVDRYAQERFRLIANFTVNRANMLTRLWKYAPDVMLSSEYLLHASVLSMVEFDEDIFAAGNCYDKMQYQDHWLYCPFAHRLQNEDAVLVKDLAVEYKYLSNSSEWFYVARKSAERVITNHNQFSRGYHTYPYNESVHTDRVEDKILTVKYEDGRWSKPYYDCGGGNIWMLTYTVPFFGYANDTYFFKGTSGIDIDLRRVDIDQCPLRPGSTQLNIFAGSDKCEKRTTECVAITGLGFRRGSYRCVCKRGFYYPDTKSKTKYYNGTVIEEEYEKSMMKLESQYGKNGVFECLPCAEGCESCQDGSPCVVSLNWLMRTAILILECCIIACLPAVVLFTWKYGNVKVVRAASPVLLRVIALGAFFIYCTTIVMYPRPNVVTCTVRVWLREIGFSLTYGALMLKTWRISVIFRVRSAKAVKITDMNLLKRLGIIVATFSVFLMIRTLVAPPVVIVGRTADDLKAYLCRTDWWDHSFTTLEVMFLIWGIRLCIVVRKAPSEFNESRFISMAIYNEFLLSVFLNVSMLFLQSPANPDLLYIIFFCHTQLTVTLLLCLIFGSKAYMVFRGGDKEDSIGKLSGATGKFLGKGCRPGTAPFSNQTNSISLQHGNFTEEIDGFSDEFRRICAQLEMLKEKNSRLGNRHIVARICAMQEAANRGESQVSTIQAVSSSLRLNNSSVSTTTVPDSESGKQLGRSSKEKDSSRLVEKLNSENDESLDKVEETNFDGTVTNFVPDVQIEGSNSTKLIPEGEQNPNDEPANSNSTPDSERLNEAVNEAIPLEVKVKDDSSGKDMKCNKNKSGHARTHAIVINLDDKSRFSEEVTV